jgi:hypothetical protein
MLSFAHSTRLLWAGNRNWPRKSQIYSRGSSQRRKREGGLARPTWPVLGDASGTLLSKVLWP